MVPATGEGLLPHVLCEVFPAQPLGKDDVVSVCDDLSDYIDIPRAADWGGSIVGDQQSQGHPTDEDYFIQQWAELCGGLLQQSEVGIRH